MNQQLSETMMKSLSIIAAIASVTMGSDLSSSNSIIDNSDEIGFFKDANVFYNNMPAAEK